MNLEEAKKIAEVLNLGANVSEYPFITKGIMMDTFPEFNWELNVDLELVVLEKEESTNE